ncbi:MAG: hypothetical protein JWM43_2532 [Acidobacteriaceae bacterium]|nr:hypothetical protein [Acidobacteriaceae bacterium]
MSVVRKSFHLIKLLPIALSAVLVLPSQAQKGEGVPTQALIAVDSKSAVVPTPANTTVKVENKSTPVISLTRVLPTGSQVALLIDDGLRTSVGRELGSMRDFVLSLPRGTEVFVGYMQNGRVVGSQNFTTDLAGAAQGLRIPTGMPGSSASPYFCLSDFVKNWPGEEPEAAESAGQLAPTQAPARKARFVMMITNGVDLYNGSTSPMNQNSPYVDSAVADAQRAGVPVYSIYFSDAGIRGGMASFSGQSYLQQVADGTGGRSYYNGTGNPVSMAPFLKQFQKAIAETYVATFDAPGDKKLVRVKLTTNVHGAKLRSAEQVKPGARLSATGQ